MNQRGPLEEFAYVPYPSVSNGGSNKILVVIVLQARVYGQPRVVFVLGGPGAGKGTQCEKLVQDYGFTHLSAGELLREEMKTDSKDSELIRSYMKEGQVVPVCVFVALTALLSLVNGC